MSYLYEGMFLLSQQAVAADFKGCVDFLNEVLKRADAEVLALRKWDERRLAYPIQGQKRGVYLLVYFKVAGEQIARIERDCNLSEQVLRCMVLRADHLGETELELARKDAEATLEVKIRTTDRDDDDDNRSRRYSSLATRVTPAKDSAADKPQAPSTTDKPQAAANADKPQAAVNADKPQATDTAAESAAKPQAAGVGAPATDDNTDKNA